MRSVLITGSSGFLGQFVARAFVEAGFNVRGVDAIAPVTGSPWEHISADATDPAIIADLAQQREAIIHIAAIPRPTGRAEKDIFHINMGAIYAAVEAARLVGVKRFVYASSFSVLGYPFFKKPIAPAYLPIDEAHPIAAQDIYATTKWLGEEMVEAYVRRGIFSAISLRMPWVQTPATFAVQIKPRRLRQEAARDLWAYLDARDAATAFVAAARAPTQGHLRLFLSAADSYMEQPTRELIAAFYPSCLLKQPLEGCASLISSAKAQEILGFKPLHSWRNY